MGRSSVLPILVLLGFATATLGGCSIYDSRFSYAPAPASIEVSLPESDDTVRTLATVIGIRRVTSESGIPASVEIRLLVENHSPASTVTLDPATLSLVAGNVNRFPDPIVSPPGPTVVAPDQNAFVTAFFPFPNGSIPGVFDLAGLNLRWALHADGHASTHSASFARRVHVYAHPTYTFGVHYGHGYHWHGGFRYRW